MVSTPDTSPQAKGASGAVGYRYPTTGLLSLLPRSMVPYGELMRPHKPAGYFAFYFPHLTGFLFAQAVLDPSMRFSVEQQTARHLYILIGTLFLRGAACTWNDTLDAPYDRQVARCRLRPIARKAVTRVDGVWFMLVQTFLGISLGLAHLPSECWIPAGFLAATQFVYPLFKRFTNVPQLWLGLSFSWGIAVGAGAGGLRVGRLLSQLVRNGLHTSGLGGVLGQAEAPRTNMTAWDRQVASALICLYIANALNTLVYDTIYGHQDLVDDLKAGVKSLAIAWQDKTKRNCVFLAVLEVALIRSSGTFVGLGPGFDFFAVGGTALVLSFFVYHVRLKEPASCMRCFTYLIWGTGLTLAVGLLMSGV